MGLPEDPTQVIRQNLTTNPRGGLGSTVGWTNNGAATFAAATTLPTTSGLPASITTGFHAIGGDNADAIFTSSSVTSGGIYTVSAYARITTLAGASRIELNIGGGTATGTTIGVGATDRLSAIGGSFVRLTLGFTATSTGTLMWRIRQLSAGAAEWYWTAAMVEATVAPNSPGSYFDGGDEFQLNGDNPSWLGAEHASVSQLEVGLFVLGGSA